MSVLRQRFGEILAFSAQKRGAALLRERCTSFDLIFIFAGQEAGPGARHARWCHRSSRGPGAPGGGGGWPR